MAKPGIPIGELRPLAHQPPRQRDGELVFELPLREVAIEGDVDLVGAVVSRCDGRHTVAEIAAEIDGDSADVQELVEGLLAHDVLTDCNQAWRTFHRQSSVTSGLSRPLSDSQLRELMGERFEARHGEKYHPLRPGAGALAGLAAMRGSAQPEGGAREVGFDELSSLLAVMYGRPEGSGRPIPSGGGIYPLVIHVLLRKPVPPLDPGLWWYEPEREGLWLVRDENLDTEGLLLSHPVTDPLISFGHPIVFISADLERPSRKYGNRGYRFSLMEAGAAMQNAYLLGAQLDLPVRAIGGIIEEPVDAFLELPADTHSLLALLVGN